MLHVHAGAVNGRVVARRRIAEVLRLDLAPVNGGAGNRNAKLFAGGFSRGWPCRFILLINVSRCIIAEPESPAPRGFVVGERPDLKARAAGIARR